jgi:hypothetical protein
MAHLFIVGSFLFLEVSVLPFLFTRERYLFCDPASVPHSPQSPELFAVTAWWQVAISPLLVLPVPRPHRLGCLMPRGIRELNKQTPVGLGD